MYSICYTDCLVSHQPMGILNDYFLEQQTEYLQDDLGTNLYCSVPKNHWLIKCFIFSFVSKYIDKQFTLRAMIRLASIVSLMYESDAYDMQKAQDNTVLVKCYQISRLFGMEKPYRSSCIRSECDFRNSNTCQLVQFSIMLISTFTNSIENTAHHTLIFEIQAK